MIRVSTSTLCDNCCREPDAFTLDTGETAYWLRVPKENQDPSILTSALDFAFCAILPENGDKRHPTNDKDNFYWCAKCCEAVYPNTDLLGGSEDGED